MDAVPRLASLGWVICISSRCPRPLRGRRYTHYFLPRPRPSSPRRLCMLLFIHSEAGDMYTLSHYHGSISSPAMHAITRLLRAGCDGLGETLSACAPLICCTPFPPPRSFIKDEREDGKEGSLVTVKELAMFHPAALVFNRASTCFNEMQLCINNI